MPVCATTRWLWAIASGSPATALSARGLSVQGWRGRKVRPSRPRSLQPAVAEQLVSARTGARHRRLPPRPRRVAGPAECGRSRVGLRNELGPFEFGCPRRRTLHVLRARRHARESRGACPNVSGVREGTATHERGVLPRLVRNRKGSHRRRHAIGAGLLPRCLKVVGATGFEPAPPPRAQGRLRRSPEAVVSEQFPVWSPKVRHRRTVLTAYGTTVRWLWDTTSGSLRSHVKY